MAKSLSDMATGKKEVTGAGYLSHDEVGEIIAGQRKQRKNKYVTGIYGLDGTAKTGIALARRTQDDIDTERPLYLFDFDKGVTPLLEEYYPDLDESGDKQFNEFGDALTDPGIVVLDPVVRHKSGPKRAAVDPEATIQQTMSMLFYIQEEGPGESSGCIMDGMNSWLKLCEGYMRQVELEIGLMDKVKQQMWHLRDEKYNQALLLAKALPCPVSYITHMKEKKKWVNIGDGKKELQTYDTVADWGSLTPGQMYQRIECTKVDTEASIELWATVHKAKGKLHLEGSKYLVASIPHDAELGDEKWEGFPWSVFK